MPSAHFIVGVVIVLGACTQKGKPPLAPENRDSEGTETLGAPRHDRDADGTAEDHRCGYVDEKGKYVIARRFDAADNFASGVAAVSENGKRGFIDATGKFSIAPAFDEAKGFREGLAAVCVAKKGWGFIESSGAWAIPPTLAIADSFSNGLAVVKDDPDEVGFCEGSEAREIPAGSECESSIDFDEDGPGKYFLIDRTGKRVNKKAYHCITRMSDGLAAVRWKDRWGYVNGKGKEVIPPRFGRAKPFGEGVAAVFVASRTNDPDQDGEWGFIDRRGRFVVRPKYRAGEVGVFSEGLISIEGLSTKTLMASRAGRNAVDRRAKQRGLTVHQMREQEGEEGGEWAAYLDKKGVLRFAVPYCSLDDGNPGQRSFREMRGGVAQVIMSEPISVVPFECAPALMGVVLMFVDRSTGGYAEPTMESLMRWASEGLVPKCRGDGQADGGDRFTWQ